MKKRVNGLLIILSLLFVNTAFLTVDYSFGESLFVKVNLFFIFLVVTFLSLSIKFAFEVFIIQMGIKFSSNNLPLKSTIKGCLESYWAFAAVMGLAFIIQVTLIRHENALFQIAAFVVSQILYSIILAINLKRENVGHLAFILLGVYNLLYVIIQVISIYHYMLAS